MYYNKNTNKFILFLSYYLQVRFSLCGSNMIRLVTSCLVKIFTVFKDIVLLEYQNLQTFLHVIHHCINKNSLQKGTFTIAYCKSQLLTSMSK